MNWNLGPALHTALAILWRHARGRLKHVVLKILSLQNSYSTSTVKMKPVQSKYPYQNAADFPHTNLIQLLRNAQSSQLRFQRTPQSPLSAKQPLLGRFFVV